MTNVSIFYLAILYGAMINAKFCFHVHAYIQFSCKRKTTLGTRALMKNWGTVPEQFIKALIPRVKKNDLTYFTMKSEEWKKTL